MRGNTADLTFKQGERISTRERDSGEGRGREKDLLRNVLGRIRLLVYAYIRAQENVVALDANAVHALCAFDAASSTDIFRTSRLHLRRYVLRR